uniref:NADH dehydrogenase [ubiquinone] 1 alpha subcomplex subunit 9, mitochondrial n=1 Tax=Photinus pyralis TaxID=7054 RepID=A0A1Y1KG50_PHOPY
MALVLHSGANVLKKHTGIISIAYVRTANYSDFNPYNLASLKRGTGGRSSFNGIVATVFGASGFIGRYVCNRLGKIGTQLILPYRGDFYPMQRLKLVGDLGQVLFQPYHLFDEESLDKAVRYSNVVINLVGRDWETRNFSFEDVHVKGARKIAEAAQRAGVKRLIHVSSLNVSEKPKAHVLEGGSKFLASKWRGEKAVLEAFPCATIIRPSDVYGQEDRFLRYYIHNWRRQVHYMPLWENGEKTIKQPLFVSDLAAGIVNAIKDPDSAGKIYQAVGPKRYLLSELVDWFYRVMRKDKEWGYYRYDMKYDPIFKLKVTLTQKLCPSWPVGHLHWERVERECITDTVERGVPTLEDLCVNLMPMENQIPWELKPYIYGIYHGRDLEDFAVRPEPPKVAASI